MYFTGGYVICARVAFLHYAAFCSRRPLIEPDTPLLRCFASWIRAADAAAIAAPAAVSFQPAKIFFLLHAAAPFRR